MLSYNVSESPSTDALMDLSHMVRVTMGHGENGPVAIGQSHNGPWSQAVGVVVSQRHTGSELHCDFRVML